MTTPAPFTPATRILQRAASNDSYRRAVGTPEYVRAVELRHKAIRTRGALPVTDYPPMPTDVDDDLDGWLDGIAQADEQERARTAKTDALGALVADCDRTIAAVANAPDRLLASLAGDIDALMKQVADAVQRLDGAHTAHDSLMKGGAAADVWRDELPPLRDAYDAIRQAQTWSMAGDLRAIHGRSNYLDDDLATDLAIANLDHVFPHWCNPQSGVQTMVVGDPHPRPWPNDPVAQLVWLSTSAAHVWVPTTKQLDAMNERRRRERTGAVDLSRSQYPLATRITTIDTNQLEDIK